MMLLAYAVPLPMAQSWADGYLTDYALSRLGQPLAATEHASLPLALFVEEFAASETWRALAHRLTGDANLVAICFRAIAPAVERMAKRWQAEKRHRDAWGPRYYADGQTFAAWRRHLAALTRHDQR